MRGVADHMSSANQPEPSKRAQSDRLPSLSIAQGLLPWFLFGLAGAVLFTIVYLIEGAIRPGYSAWRYAISALSLGPGGWIQQVNFMIYGVCTFCLALTWRKILKGSVYAIIYPIIRGIEGLALIAVGFFSQDPAPGYPPGSVLSAPTLHGQIHIIGAYVIAGAMACGFFVIAWRFARDAHWRGWVAYSLISGLLVLVFMAFFGAGQNPQNVFAGYAGLFERLATNIEPVWELLLLTRFWTGTGLLRSAL